MQHSNQEPEPAHNFSIPKLPQFVYAGVTLLMAFVAGSIAFFYPSPMVALGALVAMVMLQVMSIGLAISSLTDDRDHHSRAYVREKYGDRRAPN